MIQINRLILTTFSIFILSCNTKKENQEDTIIFGNFPEEIRVNLLPFLDRGFGFINKIHLTDSTIMLTDLEPKSEFLFYNYNLYDTTMVSTFLKRGIEWGEAITPISSGIIRDRIYWIYDPTMSRIIMRTIQTRKSNQKENLLESQITLSNFYPTLQLITDSIAIGAGGMTSIAKVDQIDLYRKITTPLINKFTNRPQYLSEKAWKNANQGSIFYLPNKEKAVLTKKFIDEFEILDLVKMKSLRVIGPENLKPKFKVGSLNGNEYIVIEEKMRRTYSMAGFLTDSLIYLAYRNGKELGTHIDQSNTIHIFDWSGKPIKKLVLSQYISAFAISNDHKEIYAFNADNKFIYKAIIN